MKNDISIEVDKLIPEAVALSKQAERRGYDPNIAFIAAMNKLAHDCGLRVLSNSEINDIKNIYKNQ